MLKDSEWNMINQILLELYSIRRMEELTERLFNMFRVLVPYSQGYFLMFDEHNGIDTEKSRFIYMSKEVQEKYLKHFYDMDYLNYIFEFTVDTSTYRDTDILDDNIRKNTKFYKEFLRPFNIPFGCGIVLLKKRKMLGIINLFRNRETGNFSDREMQILDTLKLHIENIIYNLTLMEERKQIGKIENFSKKFQLSAREQEVVELMEKGFSNKEIENILLISLSTVKKHVNHIYSKTGVKSRTQLLAMLNKWG
ncbi:MAG: LuxR C-terminal-related transcriptional regulator [Anaerocolumna sp.]